MDKTKIENQGIVLMKEKFDINEKIRRVIRDIKNQDITVKDILIIENITPEPIIVNADKLRIYEVLSNILNNAIHFTEKGKISISSYVENNLFQKEEGINRKVIIKITDTGPGIKEDLLSKIFTPFLSGSLFGTGLGLYICKNIIEAHNGKIWAENNKERNGATFSFSLPLDHQ